MASDALFMLKEGEVAVVQGGGGRTVTKKGMDPPYWYGYILLGNSESVMSRWSTVTQQSVTAVAFRSFGLGEIATSIPAMVSKS